MASSIQKFEKAVASINKGSDKRDEMRIMMAPYANWDQFLAPAPMSIALLGHLILVSADSDFSLRDKKKEAHFTLLKYPDSFRACLVQVTNQGWGAFDKAHKNMDQIRLLSSNVDGHVRTAVNFLLKGTPQEIELMLPNALKSIENIADRCVTLASSVEKEFVEVMNLIGELLEACTQAKGQYEEELKKTEIAINIAMEKKRNLENEQAEAKVKREEMMKQMKDAEKEYKDAMDKVPGAGDLMGLALADCFINVVKKISDIIPGRDENRSAGSGSTKRPRQETSKTSGGKSPLNDVISVVDKIKIQATLTERLALGDKKKNEKQPDWNEIGKDDGAEKIKQKLEDLAKDMPETTAELQEPVEELFHDGIGICDSLLQLQDAMVRDSKDVEDVMERTEKFKRKVDAVSSGFQYALAGNSLSNKSPHQAAEQAACMQEVREEDSLMKTAMQSARFKTESAKQNLTETRMLYDESCKKFEEKMQRMGNVLADLAAYNPKKLDLETIRETLIKGMQALGELKEQWGKLVKFFHMLSNLVKCSLEVSLKQFVSTSETQMKLTDLQAEMSNTMRDTLFEQAFKANQIAYVVTGIAGAYTEVSENHLMDRMTCLSKLLCLDPVTDKTKIINMREELNRGCKDAQDAIVEISRRKKKEIEEAFDKRIGRIEQEVEIVMPTMTQADIKEIDEEVKIAMNIKKAALAETSIDDMV